MWQCRLCYLRCHRSSLLKDDVCLSLMIVLIVANSIDPDEIQHSLFAKVPIYGFPVYKGLVYAHGRLTFSHVAQNIILLWMRVKSV